jgi:TetR/AcrR family transcriptional repressor of nem operon
MKVDQPTMRKHRAAILRQAGRLFRRHGVQGVAVADITSAAGLTHGAFYGHFPSKTALAAESCREALVGAAERWRQFAATARRDGDDPFAALVDAYLAPAKRDSPEQSCVLTTLGHEASRDSEMRPAMATGIEALAEVLEELIAARKPDVSPAACAELALAALSAMNGGLALARLLAADPDRSATALRAAAALAKRVVA